MNNELALKRVAISGLGLLGASLAATLRKHFPTLEVVGISSPATIQEALKLGLVQEGFSYPEINRAVEKCDLVLLCSPIEEILKQLKLWQVDAPNFEHECIISDVGSTKAEICSAGYKAFARFSKVHFIGSHPMAGSEKRGLAARDAHLFSNATWVLCNTDKESQASLQLMTDFVLRIGARPVLLSPEEHDKIAAYVSHLPQVLSSALAAYVGGQKDILNHLLQMAGGGFRDMTRLAASAHPVWQAILSSNEKELGAALNGFIDFLTQLKPQLSEGSSERLFSEANALRSQVRHSNKGFAQALTEILVDLEDKPGEMFRILTPIAKKKLNILDLEILKVREGEGGSLMMAFKTLDEAKLALNCLSEIGVEARLR